MKQRRTLWKVGHVVLPGLAAQIGHEGLQNGSCSAGWMCLERDEGRARKSEARRRTRVGDGGLGERGMHVGERSTT